MAWKQNFEITKIYLRSLQFGYKLSSPHSLLPFSLSELSTAAKCRHLPMLCSCPLFYQLGSLAVSLIWNSLFFFYHFLKSYLSFKYHFLCMINLLYKVLLIGPSSCGFYILWTLRRSSPFIPLLIFITQCTCCLLLSCSCEQSPNISSTSSSSFNCTEVPVVLTSFMVRSLNFLEIKVCPR